MKWLFLKFKTSKELHSKSEMGLQFYVHVCVYVSAHTHVHTPPWLVSSSTVFWKRWLLNHIHNKFLRLIGMFIWLRWSRVTSVEWWTLLVLHMLLSLPFKSNTVIQYWDEKLLCNHVNRTAAGKFYIGEANIHHGRNGHYSIFCSKGKKNHVFYGT